MVFSGLAIPIRDSHCWEEDLQQGVHTDVAAEITNLELKAEEHARDWTAGTLGWEAQKRG